MQTSLMKLQHAPAAGIRARHARAPVLRTVCMVHRGQTSTTLSTNEASKALPLPASSALAIAAPFLLAAPAFATGGEYGILEGRTAALIHPAIEFLLLGISLYSAYLGYQWRRTRELGDEIRALKAAAAPAAAGDAGDAPPPPNPAIAEKEKERKQLISGNYRDKHHWWGSVLLGAGVCIAIEGAVNTYMRTGKLFPGNHLYFGALIVALWALAAALVPAMQKGDNNARTAHIALNCAQIALFLSQVPTGLEIVGKVFEFTSWP